jgi:ligand-binding sensor domain-containing protein/signal transduction histidine kinase
VKLCKWLCLLLLPLAVMVSTHAVDYRMDRWTSEQGLPQNTVRCLLQTRNGYLWVGTGYGLARYDGVRFKDYTTVMMIMDPESVRVMELAEDRNGTLWVRTEQGLISYQDSRFRRYSIVEKPLNGNIHKMLSNRRGGLWLAMEDGLKLFENGSILRTYSKANGLPGNLCLPMSEDSKGRVWLVQDPSGSPKWLRLDPATDEILPLEAIIGEPLEGVRAALEDRSGKLWLTLPGTLVEWEDGRLTRHQIPYVGYDPSDGREIKEAQDGDLWFKDGVKVVHFDHGKTTTFSQASGLSDSDLRCVLVYREGSIWIGTGSVGLNRLRPKALTTLFSLDAKGWRNEVYSVSPGHSGRVWMGASSGLLSWQNEQLTVITNSIVNRRGDLTGRVAPVLEDRSGAVWVGLVGGGLNRLEKGQISHVSIPEVNPLREWSVRCFLEDQAGRLWIGTDRIGLVCLDRGKFSVFEPKDGLLHPGVTSLGEAPDGSLWIGTLGGVNHLKNNQLQAFTMGDGLMPNPASIFLVEADGTVWVGTSRGLNRIRGNEICPVTPLQGLFDSMSYSLVDDGLGNYWSHCNRGIWRVRQADLHAVAEGRSDILTTISFGESDGMISTEGNGEFQPSAARTEDGRLWFPTTRGVVVVDPAKVIENKVTPPVALEQVIVEGKVRYGDECVYEPGEVNAAAASPMPLGAGSIHVIEFRYTANSFIAPEKVRFKYRLEGYDKDWRYGAGNRAAYYTNLRPGNYRFQVTAANHHGFWNEQGDSFAFRVDPRFWQTWPFFVVCGAGILGLTGGMQACRLRWQRRMLKLEERQALADERTRIARDLHDDLGTALTGLALELDVNRRQEPNNLPKKMAVTASRARELAERMREVVWAVNPRCDTVQSLADFLQQQAGLLLRSPDLQVRFDFPDEIPNLLLNSETRHQLALSVREALANVLRHSRASRVTVTLILKKGFLAVSVQDNGCGFSPGAVREAGPFHGLANLEVRMAGIGGACECESAPGLGTTVTFKLPIDFVASEKISAK